MDKIKQNKFWFGMIGAIVVLLIVFGVLIYPLYDAQGKAQRGINFQKTNLAKVDPPGERDIETWKQYRSKIIDGYKLITSHYASSDKHLERWFSGFAGEPNRGDFMTRYRDEISNIETKLKQAGARIGMKNDPDDPEEKPKFGFNWEAPDTQHWATINGNGGLAAEKAVLKQLQKRFWARQRLANIIVDLNKADIKPDEFKVRVSRVVDFRFFKKLHPQLQNAPWEMMPTGMNKVIYRGIPVDPNTGMMMGNFGEFQLPNDLGSTITFGFALELPYSEVPKVIREMLNPANEAGVAERLLLNVIGTHVTIREQNDPIRQFYYPKGNTKELTDKTKEEQDNTKPKDVLLSVTCQMIDFDPSKIVTDFSKIKEAEAPKKK